MTNDPRIVSIRQGLVDPASKPAAPGASPTQKPASGTDFRKVLHEQANSARGAETLKFSNHATQRLERRGLDLAEEQLARLRAGVDLAASKGSRNSVVLVDEVAFVVAVPSRTVVTAIDRSQMKEQIFTNIDSAVFA